MKLVRFLETNNVLYTHQYCFRRKHSTIYTIMHLLKYISDANDKPSNEITLGLFLDLSKVFHSINHKTLLAKLNFYGIRGTPNDWFNSYLSYRYQYTEFNQIQSLILKVICGVPHGSIFGPILFLVYINDIIYCTDLFLLSFADDTTLYMSHTDPAVIYNTMNWLY